MTYANRQAIYRAVDAEIERARKKYPASDAENRLSGLTQEMGEVLQAQEKWKMDQSDATREHLRYELIQGIGQHVRALEELGLWDHCPVCGDLGMIEDVLFHPDFGPGTEWRPCPECAVVEIHWGWKVFYALCGAFLVYLVASNWGL